uniref:Uncharacterized protein n=1 Tax=Myoviridae sp. ct1IL4 TaxID=2825019 RepID=A0A8S5Q6D6_9CAUD|nr:MAG TPA: hypothetical protein [Myoviridae sp. ct1IL4]
MFDWLGRVFACRSGKEALNGLFSFIRFRL